jgi:L-threonylcarbamoyladenylate synthase
METELLAAAPAAIAHAADLLSRGEVVALPTETVYGLAADATRADAVAKIFEAKERPFFDPLIVHLPELSWLDRVAEVPRDDAALVEELIEQFWPGPLTLVLPRRAIVPDIVTAGLPTVAVRMSAHPVFRAVVERFGKPLAAPSANRFGRISPTAAAHVMAELGGRIPLIVDGGPAEHGVESTILAIEGGEMRTLRAGPVTPEDVAAVWKVVCEARGAIPTEAEVVAFFERLGVSLPAMLRIDEEVRVQAPGQLKSHYAPRTRLMILPRGAHARWPAGARVGCLAWREPLADGPFAATEILSPAGDLREAAATLFAKMRRLDESSLDLIIAEPVPEHGLGIAIMERLRKAAARDVSA